MSGYEGGPQERFEEFLRTHKDEQGSLVYWSKIQRFSIDGATSLNIDFKDMTTFDNVVFSTLAKESPSQFLDMLDTVLRSILQTEDPEYIEGLDESLIKVRIINYVSKTTHVPLRAIRSRHIGKLIHISGIMMRASEVKPLLVHATFKCRRCGEIILQTQEDGRYMEPDQCPVCGKKTPVSLIPEQSKFRDWQKVRIQESPDELPPGSMPRSVDVILEGDIVDISRPGDLVKVTGILLTTPDFTRRGGKLATFNVYIQANGVEIAEKEYEQLELSEEDKEELQKLADDPFVHRRIYASIAPSIQGHERIKESIALLLFGGVGKTLPDGTRLRGRSNILMIGDPGTGKSQILKFITGLASRSLYTSGKGTTAAGLTAAVVHDTDTGAMTLEAGALVLADQGIACIDEFDKMDPNDRTAIHEAMEQHTVSIAKAGIVATLNARTSILAAANPTLGRYEPSLSVQENIKLPFTILSRFDLTWILVDTVEPERDREIAQFILSMHQTQKTPVEPKTPPIDKDFLKKYIGYANRYAEQPQLTSEASKKIENFYVELRKQAEGGAGPVPITARQLEALVRLAEARAKMALRPKVSEEDAQAAIELVEASLRMVAYDSVTGKIDIDRYISPMSASQRGDSDKILKVMKDMEDAGTSVVNEEELLRKVEDMGLSRDNAEKIIAKLHDEGILYNPAPGKWSRVQS
ncbi:MAG: minichromosome maintenance protein MCM [Candidatus Thorarchaeota archaeon]|nr:minichromosome maintenance protein MCM [Candidatus Thorarchaeota archaeon]